MAYEGIAEYRQLGGKKYEFHSRYSTKRDAQREAVFLRQNGLFKGVRVVPCPKSPFTDPKVKWLIYTRWTMPKKKK